MIHRHRPGYGLRLLLARLHDGTDIELLRDLNSEMTLISEIGDCSYCWFRAADQLADMIIRSVRDQVAQHPHLTLDGVARYYADLLAEQLDDDDDDDDLDAA